MNGANTSLAVHNQLYHLLHLNPPVKHTNISIGNNQSVSKYQTKKLSGYSQSNTVGAEPVSSLNSLSTKAAGVLEVSSPGQLLRDEKQVTNFKY